MQDYYSIDEALFDPRNKQRIKNMILSGAVSAAAILGILHSDMFSPAEKLDILERIEPKQDPYQKMASERRDTIVNDIAEYMNYAVNCIGKSYSDIQVTPEQIYDDCVKYKYDLPLLLAQAHLESHFGVTPRARRSNSIFSVGAYDNNKDVVKFSDQNQSIEHYIRTMQNHYLNTKSVSDLLKDFTDEHNRRYASSPSYENKVRSLRNKILRRYPEMENFTLD